MNHQKRSKSRADSCASGVAFESLESRQLMAGTVSGTIFNDKNFDGVRKNTEGGVANQRVFIDSNFDGKRQSNEPLATTDSKGNYSFKNVPDGVARVHVLPTKDWRQSTVSWPYLDVNISAGSKSSGNNFGITNTAIISGVTFKDVSQDGIRQQTETLFANISVFIDKNGNKHWDAGEPKTTTSGPGLFYKFDGLAPGTYIVRIIVPSTMKLTAGQAAYRKVTVTKGTVASNRNWGLVHPT
jgi:hypothetical protein